MQRNEKYVAETTAASTVNSDHGVMESLSHTKQTYTMKLDFRLIPILGCTYTILFLDRTNSKSHMAFRNLTSIQETYVLLRSREC